MKNIKSKYFGFKKVFLILILIFTTLSCSFAKSYKPDFNVEEYISQQTEVKITGKKEIYQIEPVNKNPDTAFIFYPGGKVDYEAYLPLLVEFSKQGILCIMPHMTHNLAIYGIFSADDFIKAPEFKDIKNWYVGGHSLGGAMAATYVKKHPAKIKGLILLAAYSTANLSKNDLKVISIYGSNDCVLKMDNYQKYKTNLPANYQELILEGGNHSNFGCYGFQKGDGIATLDSKKQKELAAEFVKLKL